MRFQFVDRIDKIQKFKYARGIKTVSFEEGFLDSLHGDIGCIPRTLLIECAAQLVSWLVLFSTDFKKIPLIAKIEQAKLECKVLCGTVLTLEVEIESWNEEGARLNCRAFVQNQNIAKGIRCLCTFIDSEKLVDPEEMKIRFRELSKEAELD
jgi:3-hydroxymyristoyl/3-hydroxydecanoyl-(acyl carrier protein) dehydratase